MRLITRAWPGLVVLVAALAAPGFASAGDTMSCRLDGSLVFERPITLQTGTARYQAEAVADCVRGSTQDVGVLYSAGHVNDRGCATGFGFGAGYFGATVIDFPTASPLPDVLDLNYLFLAASGQAPLDVQYIETAAGDFGSGAGTLHMVPVGNDCLRGGTTRFDLVASFAVNFRDRQTLP